MFLTKPGFAIPDMLKEAGSDIPADYAQAFYDLIEE
jgi:hypothetical protein